MLDTENLAEETYSTEEEHYFTYMNRDILHYIVQY